MTFDEIVKKYRDARFEHLTEDELDAYHDHKLDIVSRARADAHLKNCLRCKRYLEYLIEESAVLNNRERTAQDHAIVDRAMQQTGFQQETADTKPKQPVTSIPLPERFVGYLRQAVDDWQAYFMDLEATRAASDTTDKVWDWQSEDGALKISAVLEPNNTLKIQFSSNEPDWERVRLKVRLGPLEHEATFQHNPEAGLSAEIKVPRQELPMKTSDMSIEIGWK